MIVQSRRRNKFRLIRPYSQRKKPKYIFSRCACSTNFLLRKEKKFSTSMIRHYSPRLTCICQMRKNCVVQNEEKLFFLFIFNRSTKRTDFNLTQLTHNLFLLSLNMNRHVHYLRKDSRGNFTRLQVFDSLFLYDV